MAKGEKTIWNFEQALEALKSRNWSIYLNARDLRAKPEHIRIIRKDMGEAAWISIDDLERLKVHPEVKVRNATSSKNPDQVVYCEASK